MIEANNLTWPVDGRMPVILASRDYPLWLDRTVTETEQLQPPLRPYPAEEMIAYPVSARVNSPRNDGQNLSLEIKRLGNSPESPK